MKKILKWVGISLLLLIVISGLLIYINRAKLVTRFIPAVEQVGDITIDIKNDTVYISSNLTAENKTFLKIEIDTIKYKISLFGKTYLQNSEFIGRTLHGYGKDTINFSLKIPYVTILKDLNAERKKGDSASYTIDISLHFSTFLGKSEFPVTKSAMLKIPQPPELEVMKIDYHKIRLNSITANAEIKITNYNEVGLTITELNYSMNILKQGKLKGSYIPPIEIKGNGVSFITIPITITPKNLGKTIFDIARNKDNYAYTLSLDGKLESSTTPKRNFQVSIVKSGRMELKK
jgi:LEA14-like dessication related protein